MVAPLSVWPLENLGTFKYVLFGPLVAKVVSSRLWESTRENKKDVWCLHILIICALRCLIHQLWYSSGNMLFLSRNRLIVQKGVDFKQIDKEWNWDNGIILQALIASVACYSFPSFLSSLPSWNSRGYICVILLHMLIVEPIYYCIHRCLHSNYLFTRYHSLHHDSAVPQSFTAGHATPMEHLMLSALIAIPIVGATVLGLGSISMIYSYVLVFDFLRCMGHGNVEVVPRLIFDFFPFLRYLIYTPTYHSLHHAEKDKNFCLFMPLYDILGNTLNNKSWEMHRKNLCSGKNGRIPDFVFLAHVVDFTAALHVPFVFRSFSSKPFTNSIFVLPLLPGAFLAMLIMWTSSKTFLISFYNLRGRLFQTWAVPRFGFQYFLPFARDGINHHIEEAILRADKLGIKVLSLAALNKNEALNGGGLLFVKKHPNLKVRVVHGNTLTAAVIVNEISEDVREVFLTGATSKLGRAIALYLCRRGVRVLMLTQSEERFKAIQEEAPGECRSFLVQVRKYRAAQGCKTWIVGKWVTPREQRWAAPGTHFHQFVVPSIFSCRRDCTYSSLAAMKLPEDVEGLGACEYTMGRGVVHACHAGGVVHLLEGWTHHEVGAIDVDKIDVVWEAALRHGLRPVS